MVRSRLKSVLRPVRGPLKAVRRRLPAAVDARVSRVLGVKPLPRSTEPPRAVVDAALAARPAVPTGDVRLYVGPANFAGQGRLWARAVEAHRPGAGAVNMAVDIPGGFNHPADHTVPRQVYLESTRWQESQLAYVRDGFTHVLLEAQRPLFGALLRSNALVEARLLQGHGLRVATIAHGRDVRLPSRHRENYPWSPFEEDWESTPILEAQVLRNLAALEQLDAPAFVSTPDLLDDLPDATWCPVVVDPAEWHSDRPPLAEPRPVVVHAPTNPTFKGSDRVDPVLQALAERGVIEYRRVTQASSAEMRRIIASADVVLDQFRLGSYGVTACEAMAAGRVVLGHVTEHNRERVRQAAGTDLPIVEATVADVEEVLLGLLEDRERAAAVGAAGEAFVRTLHDGAASARALAPFLDERRT